MPDSATLPIAATTRYCAVYGHPVQHSASPAMQNAGFAALGLNWRYLAFDVRPKELQTALAGARAMRFIGLNLTVPHKLLAVEMMDALDESARQWGTVNTVRFEARSPDRTWQPLAQFEEAPETKVRARGFNTDAEAIARALREDLGIEVAGACVLLLGAGGAGRTAALKLASAKVGELWLANRTAARAVALAREVQRRFPSVAVRVGYPAGRVDLVLNATSLGLKADDPLPLDLSRLPLNRAAAVFDMIYRPALTPLLRAAQAVGCRTANGLGMLLYQGTKALEIWTDRGAPIDVMRHALEQNVYGGGGHV